jgi:hypothetical protein
MGRHALVADCTRCIGLCCVAFAFDRGSSFGLDKEADVACHHLAFSSAGGGACSIHPRRAEYGFLGCVRYDCLGAGQRVTMRFSGRQRDRTMLEAFRRTAELHQWLALLDATRRLPLDPPRAVVRDALVERLEKDDAIADARLEGEVRAFVRGLREFASLTPPQDSEDSEFASLTPRVSSAPGRSALGARRKRGLPMIGSCR